MSKRRRTVVTLGDLVAAIVDAGGSVEAAVSLLSPDSPLYRLLGGRLVVSRASR